MHNRVPLSFQELLAMADARRSEERIPALGAERSSEDKTPGLGSSLVLGSAVGHVQPDGSTTHGGFLESSPD